MTFNQLRQKLDLPFFYTYQLSKLFPDEDTATIRVQISRFEKNKKIIRLKRGLYLLNDHGLDEFMLANLIYQPSYVSLESVLNIAGVIPDVPQMVTSISTVKPQLHKSELGNFQYSKIKKSLYFGFETHILPNGMGYQQALPEKALLDLIYVRNIKNLDEYRFDIAILNDKKLARFVSHYPDWMKKLL